MLLELRVKNLALIDNAALSFKKGMTVITGETGAGKSLLIGAVELLLGARADASLIREKESEAVIEGIFDVSRSSIVKALLKEQGMTGDDDTLIVRRILSREGRAKILINGVTATLQELIPLISPLLDLSGQHEQAQLFNHNHQRALLDQFNDVALCLEKYQQVYQEYQKTHKNLVELKASLATRAERLELCEQKINEIKSANIKATDEEESLLAERSKLRGREALVELCQDLAQAEKQTTALHKIFTRKDKIVSADSRLEEPFKLLKDTLTNLDEVYSFFSRYLTTLNDQPGRLEQIEERLYLFQTLRRKYGETLLDVIKKLKELEDEKAKLTDSDISLEALTKKEQSLLVDLKKEALLLSGARQKRAKILEASVTKRLAGLAFLKARFCIEINSPKNPAPTDFTASGFDQIEWLLAANVGEGLKPLARAASGGELSRILLALKLVFNEGSESTTLVFDEVDAGIGGAVAEKVGAELSELSAKNQVLCVTHLAQVAAFADTHFVIVKETINNRTVTQIKEVTKKEREIEIARLLSGSDSKAALLHARELLAQK